VVYIYLSNFTKLNEIFDDIQILLPAKKTFSKLRRYPRDNQTLQFEDRQYNGHKIKDKRRSAKHYTEI